MKNILRSLSRAFLFALLPACLLCSCSGGNGDNASSSTPAETTPAPEPQLLTVVDKTEAKLTIIRPESDSGVTTRFAKALRSKLNNYFKAQFTLSDDWYSPSVPGATPISESYELLVGDVDRDETRAARGELTADEYMIRVTDRKIVIVGYDRNALAAALRYFFVEMCKYSEHSDSETRSLAFPVGLEVKNKVGSAERATLLRADRDTAVTANLDSRVFKASGGDYRFAQGGACDGEYIYLTYITNDVGVIKKVRMSDWKLVKTSEPFATHHGNDMTYDSKRGLLVLVHMAENRISFISPETLTVTESRVLPYSSYAIAYNAKTDSYVIASGGWFKFTDSEFNVKHEAAIMDFGFIGQGLDADDDFLYLPQSWPSTAKERTNIIQIYDWNGNHLRNVTVYSAMESETVFHSGDDFYIYFNDSSYREPEVHKISFFRDFK